MAQSRRSEFVHGTDVTLSKCASVDRIRAGRPFPKMIFEGP
jgi:hypothetical protein